MENYSNTNLNSVSIEPVLAPLTAVPSGVEETELTQARHSVARVVVTDVDVPIALTRLTLAILSLRLSKVPGAAGLASVPDIIGFTHTELVLGILREQAVTGDSETIEKRMECRDITLRCLHLHMSV